jgi:hypothetical protein
MDTYYVALHQVETTMKRQVEMPDNPEPPERPDTRRQRPTRTARARLAIGAALYRLAAAIDPAAPVPSRQA